MRNGKIGVTTENIFPVIKKFLYSDHEIFLRELVSNAVDATQKLKTLSAKNEFQGELGDITIHISVDADKKTLTVTDRGIGMTADEIDRYINQIAFSGAEEFLAKYKDQAIIGHFGLGFYSSFMVASTHRLWWPTRLRFSHSRITPMRLRCTGRATAHPSIRWRSLRRSASVEHLSYCTSRTTARSIARSRRWRSF